MCVGGGVPRGGVVPSKLGEVDVCLESCGAAERRAARWITEKNFGLATRPSAYLTSIICADWTSPSLT